MITLNYSVAEPVVDYSPVTRAAVKDILGRFAPNDCTGISKARYGRLYDGGYVMAEDFDGVSTAFSLGIDHDVSWDLDMAGKGIKIFQYDHTIERLPETHSLFKWEKTAIVPERLGPGFKTLADVVAENSTLADQDLILKCDIEGFEWPVFSQCGSDLLARFRQIVIETHAFHILTNPGHAELIRRAAVNLSANHRVVHVHANNYAPWAILGGIPVPTVLEFTLLRKDRGIFKPSTLEFPTELDMPNDVSRVDYPLGKFRF